MYKISPYVPYIYKCSKTTNLNKFYFVINKKNYIDLINFSKGLYLYLCNYSHKCDGLLINFTKTLFRDITKNELVKRNKRDLCLLMLLYIKCKKVCKTFALDKKTINYINYAIEENLDEFDEDDLSTVLTFLYCTNNYILYSNKNIGKNKINMKITKLIINKSTYYLHKFKQMKNLCILYSYLCRENIIVQLHNEILNKIFNGIGKCKDTDITNIFYNFYYINKFFFKNFLHKIYEFVACYKNEQKIEDSKCNSDEYEKGNKSNLGNLKSVDLDNFIESGNEYTGSGNDHTKNGDDIKQFADGKSLLRKSCYNFKDTNLNTTFNNLFNVYNCNIYVYRFINKYNKLISEKKIVNLADRCNFVDNIWKNCRLLYGFYAHFKDYLNRSNDHLLMDNIKGDIKNIKNFNTNNIKLYSNFFDYDNIKLFMYIYVNGINYYNDYFNGCREFLNQHILDVLRINLKREKENEEKSKYKEKNTIKLLNNEHVNILINVLNQMNIQNDNIYNLIIDHFKRHKNYSLKAALLVLHFSFSYKCNNDYYGLYKHINKIMDDDAACNSNFLSNNYGYLFFPPYTFNNNIYTLYIQIFIKSVIYYFKKKQNIQGCKLNDELLYFGLCYNILLYREKNKLFLQFFKLYHLQKIYEFIHKFEKVTKKNSSNINIKKTKKLNMCYFFLKNSNIEILLKCIELSFRQVENMYINFFHIFSIHQYYSYKYINYGNLYYSPSIAPSIIVQR